jgi:DNA-binding LytR/AlgR family response regulator
MRALVLEDEAPATARLITMIARLRPDAEILAVLESVAGAADWIAAHAPPDIAFVDIRLADGTCFDLFDVADIGAPIVFCTAHDEFALPAFKSNGIDYLLKPIDEGDLASALAKFERLSRSAAASPRATLRRLGASPGYKTRFVVRAGARLLPVKTESVRGFFARDKGVTANLESGETYYIDYTLNELEAALDPAAFFRISRAAIVAANSVKSAELADGRWSVEIAGAPEPLGVSRARSAAFRAWLSD